jgi:hypothetical protein
MEGTFAKGGSVVQPGLAKALTWPLPIVSFLPAPLKWFSMPLFSMREKILEDPALKNTGFYRV